MLSNLPKNWKLLPFEKVLSEPLRNGIYKKKEFHGRGTKIVNMGELFSYPRLKNGVDMKRVELNERELDKATLLKGDLIFARRSLTAEGAGKCSIILSEDEPLTFESSIIRARLNQKLASPEYFYYLFNSPFGKWLLGTILRQVAVAGITGSDLAKLEVPVPPIDIQNQIASTGCLIDDFIAVNSQTNQTLEAIAQTLFKSWFVDFDPVKAKISVLAAGGSAEEAERAAMCAISARDEASLNTLQTAQPKAYAELARTAALFPSGMHDSELGEIPLGWELSEIGKEVNIVGGGTPSTKQSEYWDNGDICWTTPKDLSNATDKIILDTERKITKEGLNKISSGLLPVNTVLLSSRAPVGYLALSKVPLAINQGYIAMRCEQNLPPEYVLLWASSVMDEIKQRASGTTFAEISKKNFKPINVVVPSKALLDIFTQRASNIYDQIANQVSENSSLTRVRDTLLPKLLSGELTLPDNTPPKANPPESDTLEEQKSQQPLMEAAG